MIAPLLNLYVTKKKCSDNTIAYLRDLTSVNDRHKRKRKILKEEGDDGKRITWLDVLDE